MLPKPDITKPVFQDPMFSPMAIYIQIGLCPICHNPIYEKDFTDELSRREFSISGLCQTCQDSVFNEDF